MAPNISPPRSPNTHAGNGVSGRVLAERASRWNDLALRVLSALVLLPVSLACVWAGGYPFLFLVAIGCVILCHEWFGMCGVASVTRILGFAGTLVVALLLTKAGHAGIALALLAIGTVATAGGLWRVLAKAERGRFDLGFGVPYIGLAGVALIWLRDDPIAGWPNILFALCIVWGSDIGAYMLGRLLGGPKLAPAISPGKTWSGAAGGLAGATAGGILVAACFSPVFSPAYAIELALGLGVVSQAGDLLESGLKRHFGVKDSGRIIPGHGGLLDRLDSLLAVAPVAAVLACSVGRGVVLWR